VPPNDFSWQARAFAAAVSLFDSIFASRQDAPCGLGKARVRLVFPWPFGFYSFSCSCSKSERIARTRTKRKTISTVAFARGHESATNCGLPLTGLSRPPLPEGEGRVRAVFPIPSQVLRIELRGLLAFQDGVVENDLAILPFLRCPLIATACCHFERSGRGSREEISRFRST
jgi:hypothetical protein